MAGFDGFGRVSNGRAKEDRMQEFEEDVEDGYANSGL